MKTLLILLLLGAGPLVADEPLKGMICFGTDCTPATGSRFEVKPADLERRFVWTSSDGSHAVLGTLAAKAVAIDLDSKDARNVTLSVRGDVRRGWPVETRFAIAVNKERRWRWSVPAKLIDKPLSIRVPHGSYSMQIGAEHHKNERRQLNVDTKDVALHQVTLAPLSAVNGRVVTMKKSGHENEPKETPVAGAQLASSEGKVLGSTNEQGAFRLELGEPSTKELVIISPGLGSRVVPLNILAADTDLGVISLSSGVKLTIHLDRADSVRAKALHVRLREESKTQYENTDIAARELKGGDDELVFSDLSEGEYYVTLTGEGPLEQLTTMISIKSEDVAKELHLSPFQLRGSVRLGSEPLREGNVGIHERYHTWTVDAPIDGEGHFGGTMWQTEGISGWVTSKETGTLPTDHDPTLTGDPATWDITFRRRLITGRIFDEETKEPIARAGLGMQLEAKGQDGSVGGRLYTTTNVGDEGRFSIVATRDGVYDLTASAPEHINAKTTIELTDQDESKTADFPLSRGIEQIIDFVWPGGEPVGNAMVIEGVSRDGHNPLWMGGSDAAGRLKLRMRAGETKTLFVVPKEGSFAPVHVVGDETKPMRIIVPQPTASLVLTFRDPDRKPTMAGTSIRWNGEWLPGSVVGRLNFSRAGDGAVRIALLPAGSYELWGVGGPQALFGPPPREPVRVGLSSGEQTAEITVPK